MDWREVNLPAVGPRRIAGETQVVTSGLRRRIGEVVATHRCEHIIEHWRKPYEQMVKKLGRVGMLVAGPVALDAPLLAPAEAVDRGEYRLGVARR